MSPYSQLPVVTDPGVATAQILAALLALLNPGSDPNGWRAGEGAPEVALAEAIGAAAAATNAATQNAADVAISGFGASILGLVPITGTRASMPVTITVGVAGAQVPAGLTVYGVNPAGAQVAFATSAVLTAVSTTVTTVLTAIDVGPDYNGVPAGPLTIVTATSTVLSVTATAASSGGVRAETLLEFNGRLVANQSTSGPSAVLAGNVAVIARNTAGVQRALALDNYDATATPHSPVARCVTVIPVDSAGQPLTTDEKAALSVSLARYREVNFIFRVADPAYTTITVAYAAVTAANTSNAAVRLAINAAVKAYLSPAAWGGVAANRDDSGVATDWIDTPVVSFYGVVGAILSVGGVSVSSVTVNGGTSDVTMTGPAALPSASSTVSGTVTGGSA